MTDERRRIANPGRAAVLIVAVVDQQTQRSPKSNKVRAVSGLPVTASVSRDSNPSLDLPHSWDSRDEYGSNTSILT